MTDILADDEITRRRLIKVITVLVVVLVVLAATTAYEVNINSRDNRLLNSVSRTQENAFDCENAQALSILQGKISSPFTSAYEFNPPIADPKNVTWIAPSLLQYWPQSVNSSSFRLYEVWGVVWDLNNNTSHVYSANMVYVLNCPIG